MVKTLVKILYTTEIWVHINIYTHSFVHSLNCSLKFVSSANGCTGSIHNHNVSCFSLCTTWIGWLQAIQLRYLNVIQLSFVFARLLVAEWRPACIWIFLAKLYLFNLEASCTSAHLCNPQASCTSAHLCNPQASRTSAHLCNPKASHTSAHSCNSQARFTSAHLLACSY